MLLRRPSAYIPLLITAAFLVVFAILLEQGQLARQPDEGAIAHLFQILMPLQFLIMLFFAFTWVPKQSKAALQVLALQLTCAAAVLAVVYFRNL